MRVAADLRCLVMGPWNQKALPKWWGSLSDAQRAEMRALRQRDELTSEQVALMVETGVLVAGAGVAGNDLTYWMTEEIEDFVAGQEH